LYIVSSTYLIQTVYTHNIHLLTSISDVFDHSLPLPAKQPSKQTNSNANAIVHANSSPHSPSSSHGFSGLK
jgi:hypothetical protein